MAAACREVATGRKSLERADKFCFVSRTYASSHGGAGTAVRLRAHRVDCAVRVQASASHGCKSASFRYSHVRASPAASEYRPHFPTDASQTSDATRAASPASSTTPNERPPESHFEMYHRGHGAD